MFIDPKIKERLNDKLLKTVIYQEEQESKKKSITNGFNSEINGAKARISAIANCLRTGDLMSLDDIFDPDEIKYIETGFKAHGTLRPPE